MSDKWENLRKRARTLENSVDVKLVLLNKLNSSGGDKRAADASSVASRQKVFDGLVETIEDLLQQLNQCNDEMSDAVSRAAAGSWAEAPAIQHTLRRHREILRDYGTEFRRARDNVQFQLQRDTLLAGQQSPGGSSLNNRVKGADMYLRENEHINSCDRLLDEQINIAMATKENLARQGMNMRGITRKMNQLTKKYPMLGSIMNKIQHKKRKDTLIMAAVISSCLIFTLFYLMH